MEILVLFGILGLMLIVLAGRGKQKESEELIRSIEILSAAKKTPRDTFKNDYIEELRSIANNVPTVDALAMLKNDASKRLVRSLPVRFAEMPEQERIEIIISVFNF